MIRDLEFNPAAIEDVPAIWLLLQQGIRLRRSQGSKQWQDGYPNPETVEEDIRQDAGFVLCEGDQVIAYVALMVNGEPEYDNIQQGSWKGTGDYLVFHRLAVSEDYLGHGLGKRMFLEIERHARKLGVENLRADTSFDNGAMLAIFEKQGYSYCGKVYFRGQERLAYEKVLK